MRIQPRGPYVVCGAGTAARLAEMVARALVDRGREVALLGCVPRTPRAGRPLSTSVADIAKGSLTWVRLRLRRRAQERLQAIRFADPTALARAIRTVGPR